LVAIHADRLKVKIRARAVEDEANKALLIFVAELGSLNRL
jgi:uncharacterized protein YggU (UPF0235/DUF167 family)